MSIEVIRGLYDYHRWANRRLFDIALARGEEPLERDMGPQWSFPSVRRMFAHIYGADALWLTRWKGASPSVVPGGDIPSMTALRARWDTLEEEQRAFLAVPRAAGSAAAARAEPCHAPSQRDLHDAHAQRRLPAGHGSQHVHPRHLGAVLSGSRVRDGTSGGVPHRGRPGES